MPNVRMGSGPQKFKLGAKINISVPVRNQTSVFHSLFCKYSGSVIFIVRPIILTPCSRVLLEKLTVFQLVKKFPAFYGTKSFIIAFTSFSVPILCQINPVPHSIPLPEDPSEYYPLIYVWVYQVVSFPQATPPKPCMHVALPRNYYMIRLSHSQFDHPNNIWRRVQIIEATRYVVFYTSLLPCPS